MENDKNIYDMLNDIEIDLDEYEREDFTDIEKMKYTKAFRESTNTRTKYNNKNYKKYISAASVAIIALGIFSQTRLGVYAYSAVIDAVESIQTILGIDEDLTEYAKNINQSVSKRGLTIKIDEVLLDENKLMIAMSYDYDKELKEDEVLELMRESVYINGKYINYSSRIFYTNIDSKANEFVAIYDLGNDKYDEDIKVKIRFIEGRIWKGENEDKYRSIIGPWVFKFTINGEKLSADTNHIPINKDMKLDTGEDIKIVEYKENIFSKKVIVESQFIDYEKEILLKGRDNNGNKLEFILERSRDELEHKNETLIYEFIIDNLDYDFDKSATKLYLTPYITEYETVKGERITPNSNVEGRIIPKYKKIGDEFTINLDR